MLPNNKQVNKRPSCIKCIHYYVTHDHDKPHGCKAMGFKSMQNPAVMVFASSRIECQLFQSKIKNKQNNNTSESGNSGGGIVA